MSVQPARIESQASGGVWDATPVTVTIERHADKGCAEELEAAVEKMAALASCFPGFLGMDVTRPDSDKDPYRFAMRWSDGRGLNALKSSPDFASHMAHIDAASADVARVRERRGVETWFSISKPDQTPPPAWKAMIVAGLSIYPVISVAPGLLAPVIGGLPVWLGNIVMIVCLLPVANYVTTPFFTWLLRGWLHPKTS